MSVEKIAAVLHHAPIGGTAKLLLIGIANHEGDGGAWPAIATLARYAGVNERNARKMMQKLVSTFALAGAVPFSRSRCHLPGGGHPGLADHDSVLFA